MVNALLSARFNIKIDINQKMKNGGTPLYLATELGYTKIVQALLKADAAPNIPFENYTPVWIAVEKGHAQVLQVLSDANVDFNIPVYGVPLLVRAVEKGDLAVIKVLLDTYRTDVNQARKCDGCTALHIAIQNGRLDIVKLLLQSNQINLNLHNKEGFTPLIWAVKTNQLNIVKMLLQPKQTGSEIDINLAEPTEKWTPLHYAVFNDNIAAIELLLEDKNVDANVKNSNGVTPLYLASLNGRLNAVKALLKSDKINLHQEEKDGVSPLLIAADNGHAHIIKLLLEAKLDPNWILSDGASPLYLAASNGHFDAVQVLLEAGADPNQALLMNGYFPKCYPEGEYPPSVLESAVKIGHLDIVKLLLSYGAKPFKHESLPLCAYTELEKCCTYEAKTSDGLKEQYLIFIEIDHTIKRLIKKNQVVFMDNVKIRSQWRDRLGNIYNDYSNHVDSVSIFKKLKSIEKELDDVERTELEKMRFRLFETDRFQIDSEKKPACATGLIGGLMSGLS